MTGGGGARAALSTHIALQQAGIDSELIQSHGSPVGDATTLEAGTRRKLGRFARTVADRSIGRAIMSGGDGRNVSPGLFGSPVLSYVADADILHLHWLNDGGFRLPLFGTLPKNTVWTLHDQWAMTGGCHQVLGCNRYQTGCNRDCPAMGGGARLAAPMQRAKARAVRSGVHAVGVSSWLSRIAEHSRVFAGQTVLTIPNTVDTETFWPVPKMVARKALGLDVDRQILLMGHAGSSKLKGADLLADSLKIIDQRTHQLDLVGFGSADGPLEGRYTKHFGFVQDRTTLRLLYSAADVFAQPSRSEAFGLTVIEAFACGTPVVAFAGTGPDDIITPDTGRLVTAFDTDAYADALLSVATASAAYAEPCRQRAVHHYAHGVIARQYIALYEDILAQHT